MKYISAIVLVLKYVSISFGSTYSQEPYQCYIIKNSSILIARESDVALATYKINNGSRIHQFQTKGGVITTTACTRDGNKLLIGTGDGEISIWDIETGAVCWSRIGLAIGISSARHGSFSGDGNFVIVCDTQDRAVVLSTKNGRVVQKIDFPPMQTNIISAALAPSGDRGALIDLSDQLYLFNSQHSIPLPTNISALGPICYSVDGKVIACKSKVSLSKERILLVVGDQTRESPQIYDRIGLIRPDNDGAFYVTAYKNLQTGDPQNGKIVGLRIQPSSNMVEEMWSVSASHGYGELVDFSSASMLGVSTDYRFVTRIIDLKSGNPLVTIDNSVNARLSIVTQTDSTRNQSSLGLRPKSESVTNWLLPSILLGGIVLVGGVAAKLIWKRRRFL